MFGMLFGMLGKRLVNRTNGAGQTLKGVREVVAARLTFSSMLSSKQMQREQLVCGESGIVPYDSDQNLARVLIHPGNSDSKCRQVLLGS